MSKKTILICSIIAAATVWAYAANESVDQQRIEEYYLRGNIYYQQGKYKEAQNEYKKALDLTNSRGAEPVVEPVALSKEPAVDKQIKQVAPAAAGTGSSKEVMAYSGTQEYIIGQDDGLHISVWQNPDLDKDVMVRPDGKITYPLVGDILARGLTIPELTKEITNSLKDYIKFPQVSISLAKIGGERVMLFGQVGSPGIYSVTGGKTIMELIGMAGGFTRDSVPSSTMLIRGGLSSPKVKRINLSRVFKGDLSQNILLQSQDIIFVPRKFIADINYFLEQVLSPLRYGTALKTGYNANMTW